MRSLKEFKEFVERVEDAAQYDDVAVYLTIKRWSRLNFGDNPPACVVRTLAVIRGKFGEEQIARITAVSRASARAIGDDHSKE